MVTKTREAPAAADPPSPPSYEPPNLGDLLRQPPPDPPKPIESLLRKEEKD